MASEALQQNRTHDGRLATGGPSDTLISITGLSKHFAGEIALNNVDMDIRRGEVHGLVGANGAGKSTLINTLFNTTLYPPKEIPPPSAERPKTVAIESIGAG